MKHLTLLILIFHSLVSFAFDFKIKDYKLDLNSTSPSGKGAIMATCVLNTSGIKDQYFDFVIIVQDDNEKWHKDSFGNLVKKHMRLKSTYQETTWKDLKIYIEHDQLAPKEGKHTYRVYLYTYYNNKFYSGVHIGDYDMTGEKKVGSQYYAKDAQTTGTQTSRRSNANSTNKEKRVYRENITKFGYNEVTEYPNGNKMVVSYGPCTVCGGSRRCQFCFGNGMIYQRYYNTYSPCVACGQTGRCMCFNQDGYTVYSTICYDNNGNIIDYFDLNTVGHGSSNYNTSNTNKSSTKNSNKSSVCSYCRGTKIDPTPCDGGRASWAGYYNPSGTKCPHCGRYDGHMHSRCPSCNIPKY